MLVREFAGVVISQYKNGQLFVVVGWSCGELLEWSFGCWRGDVLVSSWEDFGMDWRSGELGILEWMELGSGEGFQAIGLGFGLGMVVEGWRRIAGCWVNDLGRKWKRIGGLKGLVQREGSLLNSGRGKEEEMLGSHALWLLSQMAKRCWRKGEGLGFIRGRLELMSTLWNLKSTGASTRADGGETGEGDWQLMPPEKGLREGREERHCRSI